MLDAYAILRPWLTNLYKKKLFWKFTTVLIYIWTILYAILVVIKAVFFYLFYVKVVNIRHINMPNRRWPISGKG